MFPMQPRQPKKRLNPNMMAESADMAAEQMQMAPNMQMQQGKPAPVIPTTNMRLPNKPMPASQPSAQPMASGMTSGFNAGNLNTQKGNNAGFRNLTTDNGSMNVTGPGDRARREGETEQQQRDRVVGGSGGKGVNPENIRDRFGVADPKSSDQLLDEAIKSLLGEGPRDTTQEEADIRRQMESDVSSGQAGLNARLAAGGGGTSGALGAMTTDMRSRAALDAANAITGVKDDARDEYLKKLNMGIGAEFTDRSADMDEAQFEMYMNMLNQLYGTPDASANAKQQQQDPNNPVRANDSGLSGSTGSFSATVEGNTLNAQTGSYQIESGKRGEDDVMRFTVQANGKVYRIFRDSNGNNYAVAA